MKYWGTSFFIILIVVVFFGFKHKIIQVKKLTTLDSLQGHWQSTQDSKWQLKIKGRVVDEYYNDAERKDDYYRMYFSDTLIDCYYEEFKLSMIDTVKRSGKYLIWYGNEGSWCYQFEGFNSDKNEFGFSIVDTWAKRRSSPFKKVK